MARNNCHQHKGRESIQPDLQAKGLEGGRGRVCGGGRLGEAVADGISHQSAEAVTE